MAPKKYMLIETSAEDKTRILAIGTIRTVPLLAKICRATVGGEYIGPPLEGKGFSKVSEMGLKYLYWNTFSLTPPEDYNTLLNACKEAAEGMAVDETPLEVLEAQVRRLYPDDPEETAENANGTPPKAKAKAKPSEAPKKSGVSKRVWDIADEMSSTGSIPTRSEVMTKAIAEGINKATAGTQYSRWRAARKTG